MLFEVLQRPTVLAPPALHSLSRQQREAQSAYERLKVEQGARLAEIEGRIGEIAREHTRYALLLRTAQGESKALEPAEITIAYPANQLSFFGRLQVWLERAWERRNPAIADLKVDPRFDSVRGDPRFDALLKRAGLGG